MKEKNATFKNYCNKSSNIDLKSCLKYLQACLNASIEVSKEKYYNAVNKLINTKKNSESILVSIKNFLK